MADSSGGFRFPLYDLKSRLHEIVAPLLNKTGLPIRGRRIAPHFGHPAHGDFASVAQLTQKRHETRAHSMKKTVQLPLVIRADLVIVQRKAHRVPSIKDAKKSACIFWPECVEVAGEPIKERKRLDRHLGHQPLEGFLRLLHERLWIELANDFLERPAEGIELVVKRQRQCDGSATLRFCSVLTIFVPHSPGLIDRSAAGTESNQYG